MFLVCFIGLGVKNKIMNLNDNQRTFLLLEQMIKNLVSYRANNQYFSTNVIPKKEIESAEAEYSNLRDKFLSDLSDDS